MKRISVLSVAVAAALTALLAGCSTGATSNSNASSGPSAAAGSSAADSSSAAGGDTVIDLNITSTTGPNGEKPTSVNDLTLTDAEVEKVKSGGYSAAMLWHTSSAFVSAVQEGAQAEFDRLGISVVATADASFDAGTQANQVQTTMVKKPSVILSLPVDPTTAASAYQPAVDAGTKLIFLSNVPAGYTQGKQYTSIVTDDLFEMGKQAAEALGKAMNGEGEVGILYYDAQYYVVNQRDAAFKQTLAKEFPNIKIVAQQGFTDPNTAEGIASAMLTQNPDLGGIYTSWAQPAQGVLAALRTANNTKTRVVTLDLDDTVAVDMVSGGQTAAIVADKAWELGKGMADAAAYSLIGKQAPAFAAAGVLTVTKDNVEQGYQDSLHTDVPEAVAAANK